MFKNDEISNSKLYQNILIFIDSLVQFRIQIKVVQSVLLKVLEIICLIDKNLRKDCSNFWNNLSIQLQNNEEISWILSDGKVLELLAFLAFGSFKKCKVALCKIFNYCFLSFFMCKNISRKK